jgi:polysaccharide export outer membrane protein
LGATGVLRVSASLLASSVVAGVLAACSIMPTTGPEIGEIHRSEQTSDPDRLPYALVKVNPQVVDGLATWAPRIANTFTDQRPPRQIKFGIGDTVSVSIFEAAAGGLFIPIEAGVRPGNFVTLPNQNVDPSGNITVPYAGAVRVANRTPAEVQQEIVNALKNRAIEPQAVVALVDQRTSLISVLGDVNNSNRFPANAAGERILDAITRAGGPKSQGYDEWVMLEREGRRATAPFGALVYEPSNNIWVHPNDTIYLYKEPQTFLAFGAFTANAISGGQQGIINFDAWRLSLAEAIGKASGLSDNTAEPAAVFLYRGETREVAQRLGIDCSRFPGPIIPVIYNVNLRNPDGYFLATKFQMRNKDVIYIANATSVEISKALNFFRLTVATVNDPIVAATNAYNLNLAIRANNRF